MCSRLFLRARKRNVTSSSQAGASFTLNQTAVRWDETSIGSGKKPRSAEFSKYFRNRFDVPADVSEILGFTIVPSQINVAPGADHMILELAFTAAVVAFVRQLYKSHLRRGDVLYGSYVGQTKSPLYRTAHGHRVR